MSSIEEKNLIIEENLKEINKDISLALEKRSAHISEKAGLATGFGKEDVRLFRDNCFIYGKSSVDCISDNKKYLEGVFSAIEEHDKLKAAECCFGKLNVNSPFGESDSQFEADAVVYLKNPLADIAYNNFSKLLNDPRALYGDSFSDVCEEVYYSRAPYCILPIENSEEGRLAAFGNMIRKYGLKIVLTYNVENTNGKLTRFALLKREVARVVCKSSISEGEFVEIGFNFGEDQKLSKVLQAAAYFGFTLNKIDSLPIYYSEKEYYFDVVFKGNGDLEKFLFWMDLEVPRYEIIGIYTQIKTIRNRHGGHYG